MRMCGTTVHHTGGKATNTDGTRINERHSISLNHAIMDGGGGGAREARGGAHRVGGNGMWKDGGGKM